MKHILITGANKGIGLAVTQACLDTDSDVHVLLGSRSQARGEQARESLVASNPGWADRITVVPLDVASNASVDEARTALLARDPDLALYGIVNNAGVGLGTVAQVLDVNLHGIRRICDAFIECVVPGGRVVNVTSASGPNFVANCTQARQAFFIDPDLDWEALSAFIEECGELEPHRLEQFGFGSDSPYGFSKACANSYTVWLARQHPALYINACTPGFIETDLGKEFLGARTPGEAGMKPPIEGARVIVELLFGVPRGSGHYYGSDALRSPMHRYRPPGSAEFTDGD